MDTPIYDELLSQISAPTPTGTCQWCGAPVDGDAVERPAIDPVSGDDTVLLACSEEHMAALEEHRAG